MKRILLAILFLFTAHLSQAQWLDLVDDTENRIVITNINDNDDPTLVDDMEKDLAVGDFNNDGFEDLVVVRKVPFSTPGAKTDLLLMNRNGVLTDETDTLAPEFLSGSSDARDVICVDVNDDDWLDLFVISTFGDQPQLYINQGNDGSGTWQGFVDESATRLPTINLSIIQYCAGWAGDLTGNDAPDLYMVNYDPSGLSLDVLFINDGNGFFTDETQTRMGDLRNSSFGTGVEFHDIDNDNDLDVIKNLGLQPLAPFNEQGILALFNNGDGTFTNWQKFPGATTYMFTAGDLNNDGFLDFYGVDDGQDYVNYITAVDPDNSVTINQVFLTSDRTDVWGGNVKMVDIDGDGDLDLTLASVDTDEPPCDTSTNGGPGGVRIFALFENDGVFGGNLVDPYDGDDQDWHIPNYDQDFIDLDNNGLKDLIMGTCEGYAIFMHQPILNTPEFNQDGILIYPNPATDIVAISLSEIIQDDSSYKILDVLGKMVIPQQIIENTTTEVSVSNLETGIYFIEILQGNTKHIQRLIKQ